jgi:hypothetical protein
MSKCEFVEDTSGSVYGITAYAEGKNACFKDTGIYLPPNHSFTNPKVNVVLWMHGYYVHSAPDIFQPKDSKTDMGLREGILDCGKDVLLIAPWLGLKESKDSGKLDLDELGKGNGCQTYLEQVLEGLVRFQNALAQKRNVPRIAKLEIGNLIVAGHSAGGARMRDAVKHLGDLVDREKLRECWGFDCFYDDANTWGTWARALPPKVKKYFYFGQGSFDWAAFAFMKYVYGTPTKPKAAHDRIFNMNLAPAIIGHLTEIDGTAFQTVEEIKKKASNKWSNALANWYDKVRITTDVFLDQPTHKKYWDEIWSKLKKHFQVVGDLFGARIRQSDVL